ncbi:tetrathionate reductase subunit B, partial [Mannheimia haemolytica]
MDITKRLFLKSALTVGAAAMPLAQAKAFMPDRRDGEGAKRYGMLIDLRKCIGCQACTVSCSVDNATPLHSFRTTVRQYEITN